MVKFHQLLYLHFMRNLKDEICRTKTQEMSSSSILGEVWEIGKKDMLRNCLGVLLIFVSKFNIYTYIFFIFFRYTYKAKISCYTIYTYAVYVIFIWFVLRHQNKLTQTFAAANPMGVITEIATCCVSKFSETTGIFFWGVLQFFSTPLKINGWNLQTTHLERKMIWTKPAWLCSMLFFRGVGQ